MGVEIIKILFLFIYIFLFFYLIKKVKITVLYSLIFFLNISVLLSLILIEYGMFIYEQAVDGYENGSFYIYLLYSFASLLLFYYLSLKKPFSNQYFHRKKINIFLPTSIVFSFVLLYCYYINPSFNRFDVFDGPFKLIFVRVEYIFSFAFLYSLISVRNISKKLIIYFIYALIMFFRGSEFGAFFIATIWFLMTFHIEEKVFSFKWIFICLVLLVLPFFIKLTFMDLISVVSRIVLEGHVFWGTINLVMQNGPNLEFSSFINNYNDLFSGFQQANIEYGFGKLMFEISPHFAEISINSNVRFAAGFPAIVIYHFGLGFGFLLYLLITLIYFFIIRFLFICFNNKNLLLSFVFFYMIFNTFSDFIIQGEYANFRVKFLIKLVITLFVYYLYKNSTNQVATKVNLSHS